MLDKAKYQNIVQKLHSDMLLLIRKHVDILQIQGCGLIKRMMMNYIPSYQDQSLSRKKKITEVKNNLRHYRHLINLTRARTIKEGKVVTYSGLTVPYFSKKFFMLNNA